MYPAYKSELLSCLEAFAVGESLPSQIDCLINDGAASKNFSKYSDRNLKPRLKEEHLEFRSKRTDLVWDLYFSDGLKTFVREGRGEGVQRQVLPTSPIPSNWSVFLRNDKNKKNRCSTCLLTMSASYLQ